LKERDIVVWLSREERIGPLKIVSVLKKISDLNELPEMNEDELKQLLGDEVGKRFPKEIKEFKCNEYENELKKKGIFIVTIFDKDYPELLRFIPDNPAVLFCIGDRTILNDDKMISIVGSRTPTVYGRETAYYFGKEFAEAGITVVSGMALGIDFAAHTAAIENGGRTIAVLGSGVDVCYPERNRKLYNSLIEKHLIISENPPGTYPLTYTFPLRNRIISGLSEGVLIVEAREKSGSLITADSALSQNRNVYAVPGRISDSLSKGTNKLIADGAAAIAISPDDILFDYYGVYCEKKHGKIKVQTDLSEDEEKVMNVMGTDPIFVEDIALKLGITVGKLLTLLIKLEKAGAIKQVDRGYYILHP